MEVPCSLFLLVARPLRINLEGPGDRIMVNPEDPGVKTQANPEMVKVQVKVHLEANP